MGTDSFGQMLIGLFVRLFFGFCLLEFTYAIFGFDFFLRITPTRAIIKAKIKRKRGQSTMRVLLRYKEPVCLLLSFVAILLVVTVYGLTHGFDSSATVDHKSPQILQELLPVDQ